MSDDQFKHQDVHKDEEADGEGGDDSKTFPMKLVEILADERYQEAICWLPHGRAFIIRNRKLFAETVMPLHFSRKAKYSSFTRKLNRWNFVRVSSGPEIGAYYHEFFLRDKPHLAAQMFCKNARTKLAMADESTPKPTATSGAGRVAATVQKQEEQSAPYGMGDSSAVTSLMQQQQDANFPPGLLQILQKDPEDNKFQNMGVSNNIQLLERQMQFLQEEHAQRVLLQRMAANRLQQQQLLQQRAMAQQQGAGAMPAMMASPQMQASMGPPMGSAPNMMNSMGSDMDPTPMMQRNNQEQRAQLMRMRQMMDLRNRQRQGLAPTNHRASAA